MRKSLSTLFVVLAVALATASFAQPELTLVGEVSARSSSPVYIIQLAEDPVVAYDGKIPGLSATRPGKGQKIDRNSNAVKAYAEHLGSRHDAVLNAAGSGAVKVYDYFYSFNGFAAVLTPQQAAALASRADVVSVWADQWRQKVTDSTSDFLGLNDPIGGLRADLGLKGEGVIIGVIDSGAWPEHPSFSDQIDLSDRPGASGDATRAYGPPPAGWSGDCQSGERWSQDDCNNKIIGARYFLDGFGHQGVFTDDYLSARDADGHGSHTGSTAGGNAGVQASILGRDLGTVTGIAPRARLAIYKGLWNGTAGGGFSSDLAAAIDAAVADGVDVINYSIGSPTPGFLGPDDIAFLFADAAGVFVATSNGNSGPGAQTVGSPSGDPWVTSVGASIDDGVTVLGLEVTAPAAVAGTYDAAESATSTRLEITGPVSGALVNGDPLDGCSPLTNAAAVAGNVALIQRGACAFTTKHLNAQAAGATAIVVFNNAPGAGPITMGGDPTGVTIPGLMIGTDDGTLLAGTTGVAVSLSADTVVPKPGLANDMAAFSSRGPNGGALDIIKPDITAPGVSILAAQTPTPNDGQLPGQLFQIISGTSMASPHVAGIGALLTEAHPDWTPAMIRSAMMTTAYQTDVTKEDGVTPADPFDMGGGHVRPNSAVDPGLVYDAGLFEYFGFLCGSSNAVSQATCDFLAGNGIPFDASDLNLPSIGIADLVGQQTVTRTVTNVGPAATYTVSADAPAGVGVVVSPNVLTLASGASDSYTATFTTTAAATLDAFAFGALTWSDGTHDVRSPIAVRPKAFDAAGEVSAAGASGTLDFDVTFGFTGAYTAGAHGLVAPSTEAGNVVDDPGNSFQFFGPGTTLHLATLSGAEIARFSLFDDFTDGNDDLDLYVFHCPGGLCTQVDFSGSGTSAEEVTLTEPADGLYAIFVHGFETDGADSNYTLFSWAAGADAGNMTITAPGSATVGATATVTVDWSGLSAGTNYLGAVSHSDAGGVLAHTILTIDVP